jgi:hypothetical protein
MSDFILYSYQCHPIHIEVNAKKPSIDPVYDQQCNREADEAMAKHQELFEKLFNTPEIHNFKKDDNLFFLHKGNYYGGKIFEGSETYTGDDIFLKAGDILGPDTVLYGHESPIIVPKNHIYEIISITYNTSSDIKNQSLYIN